MLGEVGRDMPREGGKKGVHDHFAAVQQYIRLGTLNQKKIKAHRLLILNGGREREPCLKLVSY